LEQVVKFINKHQHPSAHYIIIILGLSPIGATQPQRGEIYLERRGCRGETELERGIRRRNRIGGGRKGKRRGEQSRRETEVERGGRRRADKNQDRKGRGGGEQGRN